jgi:hypothetical protein
MRPVLKCGNATWLEIETELEATRESQLGQHGVVHFFKRDRSDDRRAAKYYSLRQNSSDMRNEPPLVTIRIPRDEQKQIPAGEKPMFDGIVAVGTGNSNPYDRYARYIFCLEAHLGVMLPETCYPYI